MEFIFERTFYYLIKGIQNSSFMTVLIVTGNSVRGNQNSFAEQTKVSIEIHKNFKWNIATYRVIGIFVFLARLQLIITVTK